MTELFFKAPLIEIPVVTDAERGLQVLRDLQDRATETGDAVLVSRVRAAVADPTASELLTSIFSHSPFLSACALSDAPFVADLLAHGPDTAFGGVIDHLKDHHSHELDQDRLMRELRIGRRRVALLVAVADLTGCWTLEQVTQRLSDFVDVALSATVSHLMLQAVDNGELALSDASFPEDDCGYVVLAMGKHGARELNYSSDVDLIVLYEPMKVDYRGKRSVQQTFIRLTQRLVAILQDRTADGYVCRVDLRLRPDPGSTPVAIPYAAAQIYYAARGENWERAAMIKARPAAGDIALGRQFLAELAPFIWRDHLDFWTLREIQAIKQQINAQRGGKEIGFFGHNVKLGRGGIREIEFFAQTQQLIFGGRDSYLRCQRTVDALTTLAESGCIDDRVADELAEAYEFLRRLEHRLQMVDDQQTQTLPSDEPDMARIASFMAFDDLDSFRGALHDHLRRVETHYSGLFERAPDRSEAKALSFEGAAPEEHVCGLLDHFGFADAAGAYERLRRWRDGGLDIADEKRGRQLLAELVPGVVEVAARTSDPDGALAGFEEFLVNLRSGARCLPLLAANPALLELMIEIVTHAPALAETLSRRPDQLQAALSSGFFAPMPEKRFLLADAADTLGRAPDLDALGARALAWANDYRFQVAVNTLRHSIDSTDAGHVLSDIADAVIKGVFDRLLADLVGEAETAGQGIVVLAFGGLGARELALNTPLDLLIIHDDDSRAAAISLDLAHRLINSLTEISDNGCLYELNRAGAPREPLGPRDIVALSDFRRSISGPRRARTMVGLCQARVVAGSSAMTESVVGTILDALTQPLDRRAIVAGVAEVRRAAGASSPTETWDPRQRSGGLDDLEAFVRCLQLIHAPATAAVPETSPVVALGTLAGLGFVEEQLAKYLIQSHHLLRQIENMIAVAVDGPFAPSSAPDGVKSALVRAGAAANFGELEIALDQATQRVRSAFTEFVEPPGD